MAPGTMTSVGSSDGFDIDGKDFKEENLNRIHYGTRRRQKQERSFSPRATFVFNENKRINLECYTCFFFQ